MPISDKAFYTQMVQTAAKSHNYKQLLKLVREQSIEDTLDIAVQEWVYPKGRDRCLPLQTPSLALWLTDQLRRQYFFSKENKQILFDTLVHIQKHEASRAFFENTVAISPEHFTFMQRPDESREDHYKREQIHISPLQYAAEHGMRCVVNLMQSEANPTGTDQLQYHDDCTKPKAIYALMMGTYLATMPLARLLMPVLMHAAPPSPMIIAFLCLMAIAGIALMTLGANTLNNQNNAQASSTPATANPKMLANKQMSSTSTDQPQNPDDLTDFLAVIGLTLSTYTVTMVFVRCLMLHAFPASPTMTSTLCLLAIVAMVGIALSINTLINHNNPQETLTPAANPDVFASKRGMFSDTAHNKDQFNNTSSQPICHR